MSEPLQTMAIDHSSCYGKKKQKPQKKQPWRQKGLVARAARGREGARSVAAWKDYRLRGGADRATILTDDSFEGRVEQVWFSPPIDRKTFKQLIKRTDAVALRHFGLWLALLVASGIAAFFTWGTWWCVPFFAVYGVLYAAA